MSNETISKWLGECRHDWTLTGESDFPGEDAHIWTCSKCEEEQPSFLIKPIEPKSPMSDYENDPSAWTQELYDKIADAELFERMQYWLYAVINIERTITCVGHSIMLGSVTMGRFIRATPAQKAAALSRAIEEASDEKA